MLLSRIVQKKTGITKSISDKNAPAPLKKIKKFKKAKTQQPTVKQMACC